MNKKENPQHKMVGWYDPRQLVQTGWEVIVSAMFGRHADKRVIQAIADAGSLKSRLYHAVPYAGGEYWFDYISDVGDGFDSTYTVAYHATRPSLRLSAKGSNSLIDTKQGELLVFGGDEVYPTAGAKDYDERLVHPYNLAFPKKSKAQLKDPNLKHPAVFAIPGNHDWYDSLASFMNLFCRQKDFCGWKTYQNRSYFAVKLPQGWWLFGTDMQLSSSLDDAQMDFFKTVVREHMAKDDRIILCNAEPYWITDKMYRDDPSYNNRNMGWFEGYHLDHRAVIFVAGDRHYYRHHEETSNKGKKVDAASRSKKRRIVAGGGGAFLHPTHREGVNEIGRDRIYSLKASYPADSTSFWLTFRNLLFPFLNLQFGFVTGALYLLTAQAFRADLSESDRSEWWLAVKAVLSDVVTEPIATFWVALIMLAFFFFTDTHSRYLRFVAGPLHALAHFAGVFLLGWAAAVWFADYSTVWRIVASALLIFGGGYFLGGFIMGIYLLITLNVFGVHHNEAFSSLSIERYKNFLRFRIDADGTLTIFPIGIETPVKDWKKGDRSAGEPGCVPQTNPMPDKNRPFLIEEPIIFEKPVADGEPQLAAERQDQNTLVELRSDELIEHKVQI
jgi:hypothetical protein